VAANQVFVVISASAKLGTRAVAYILPPSVLATNLNDAVTVCVSVATWIRIQDGHLSYQASKIFFGLSRQKLSFKSLKAEALELVGFLSQFDAPNTQNFDNFRVVAIQILGFQSTFKTCNISHARYCIQ
jgi:hypothetical protein